MSEHVSSTWVSTLNIDLNDPECDTQKIWEFYFDQWKQQEEPKHRSLKYHMTFSVVDLTRFFIARIQDLSDSEWDVVYRIATNFICVWKLAGFIKFYGYKVDNLEEYISTEFNPPNSGPSYTLYTPIRMRSANWSSVGF